MNRIFFLIVLFIITTTQLYSQNKVKIDGKDENYNSKVEQANQINWVSVNSNREKQSLLSNKMGQLGNKLLSNGKPVSAIVNSFETSDEQKISAIRNYLAQNQSLCSEIISIKKQHDKLREEEHNLLNRDYEYRRFEQSLNTCGYNYESFQSALKNLESKSSSKTNNSSDFHNIDNENTIENNTSNQPNDTYNKINETNAAYDKLGDEVGAELGEIFSGELKPQNIMNITESILNSGLLKTIDGIGAVSIGGGVLAAGVGLLQEAKQDKIKNNVNSLKHNLDKYKSEYNNFQNAVKNNNDIELLISHKILVEIEADILDNSRYLIRKAEQNELKELESNIRKSNEKRNKGVKIVKQRLLSNFHDLKPTERQNLANSGYFSQEEIYNLKNPFNIDGFGRYYNNKWKLIATGSLKNSLKNGEWKYYDEEGNLIGTENYLNGQLQGGNYSYYPSGKVYGERKVVQNKTSSISSLNFYYETGEIKTSGQLKNNSKTGIWYTYHKNRQISQIIEFELGRINGLLKQFYENGQLEYEATFIDDLRNGIAKWYHKNGQLRQSIVYKTILDKKKNPIEKRIEILKSYDQKGTPLDKGNLKNGNGYINEYSEEGILTRITKYKDGILIKEVKEEEKLKKAYEKQLRELKNETQEIVNDDSEDNKTIEVVKQPIIESNKTIESLTFTKPQSIQELLKNIIKARGGTENLNGVKTLKQVWSIESSTNLTSLSSKSHIKKTEIIDKNGKYYSQTETPKVDGLDGTGSNVITIINGNKGATFLDGKKTKIKKHLIPKYDANNNPFFFELTFLNNQELKNKLTDFNEEKKNDKNYYTFIQDFSIGSISSKVKYYYNQETFVLEFQEQFLREKLHSTTKYLEYDIYKGIIFPTKKETIMDNGNIVSLEILEENYVNEKVNESDFDF